MKSALHSTGYSTGFSTIIEPVEPVDNIALFQHLPQWKMHPLLNIDGDLHYLASASSTGKKKSFEYI
jgi:hypothetical protein